MDAVGRTVPGRMRPLVSVIIPTIGRPTLRRSVASAVSQGDVEVVVVNDGVRSLDDHLSGFDAAVRVVATPECARGTGLARQIGTAAAVGRYVAYLDDDDWMVTGRLAAQIEALTGSDANVASGRVQFVDAVGRPVGRPSPRTCFDGGDISEYLFHRRRLAMHRNLLHTSTLTVERRIAQQVGWREMPRHQDWDFVLRLDTNAARFVQLQKTVAIVELPASDGISAGPDWKESIPFLEANYGLMSRRARADFIAGQVLRYAFQARSRRGVARALRLLARTGSPSLRAAVLGVSGLVGRPTDLVVRAHQPANTSHLPLPQRTHTHSLRKP